MTARDFIKPGDCLLYRPASWIGWAIAIKTWHAVSHCEAYVGLGCSVAARGPQDGKGGVGAYGLRLDGLAHILRPRAPFDIDAAARWFHTVEGQRYDWWGLFRFFTVGGEQPHDRMFCSEFLTRWYRNGNLEPFQPDEDADGIAPFQFLTSPMFDHWVVNNGLITPAHHIKE